MEVYHRKHFQNTLYTFNAVAMAHILEATSNLNSINSTTIL